MSRKGKLVFYGLLFLGYLIGVILSYPYLERQTIKKEYCVESVGPQSCHPAFEDCDVECLKYDYKIETKGKEAFYTYGLLGAFVGGWLAVFVVTFILKE